MEGIATLYMLDDNWLTIAEDMPEIYGHLFSKGNPQFDTFIEAIPKCKAVITYNHKLMTDITKHNKNVVLCPLNINLDFYSSTAKASLHVENEIIIGYAGSLRHDDIAFKALANIARTHDNIKVLLFGSVSVEQIQLFNGLNTIILNYMPYPMYCKAIMEVAPDILLAPLINNKTSESKCPNKYLEAGATNSAGVYTNISPYNTVVKDGYNGLLVDNYTVEAWEEKILLLVNSNELLTSIKRNCHEDVKRHYSTDIHLIEFCQMITNIIK